MRSSFRALAAACLLSLAMPFPARAEAIDPIPLKIVDDLHAAILKLQKADPKLARPTQDKLRLAFEPVTHFEEIAEEVLEYYASGWTIGEWRELSKKLGAVIRADSIWALKPYAVDRYEIVETTTIFRTVVVKARAWHAGEAMPITYHLNREDGVWYIVQYKVGDLDLVDEYQKHYDALFKVGFLQPIIDQLERDVLTHPTRTGQP
jgi:hypothetical protein